MTEENVHTTIRASVEKFQQMIRQSSLEGEVEHSDIYLNVLEDKVQVLQAAPGEVVLTYCTFGADFFDEIDLQRDVREMTSQDSGGEEFTFDVGAEAILDVEQTLTYLDFAAEGGTVELEFTGSEERRLSTFVRANGALEAWVKLPGSQDVLDSVPHWLPLRFSDADCYTNQAGDEAPTQISTKASKIDTIIRAVKEDREAEFYPLVVEDGEFRIDVGDDQRSGVQGTLGAQSIEGPEVENYYFDGFEEIFNVLSGKVELQTAPGGNPVSIVQKGDTGQTIRHVNGSVDE